MNYSIQEFFCMVSLKSTRMIAHIGIQQHAWIQKICPGGEGSEEWLCLSGLILVNLPCEFDKFDFFLPPPLPSLSRTFKYCLKRRYYTYIYKDEHLSKVNTCIKIESNVGGGGYLETLRVVHKRLFHSEVLLTVNNKTFIVYSK